MAFHPPDHRPPTADPPDPRLEALGIGGGPEEVEPRNGRSVLELWNGQEWDDEGLVYVVGISDGYAVGAHDSYSDALMDAEYNTEQEGSTDVIISKYERVPAGLKLVVLAHFEPRGTGPHSKALAESGILGPILSDGYSVSHVLSPYTSSETLSNDPKRPWEERGVVWKWSMYEDVDYENWWPEQRDDYRREQLYRARPKEPLSMDEEAVEAMRMLGIEVPCLQEGLRLFFRTSDPMYYLEQIEEGLLVGGPWLAASPRPEDAPWDENDLGDGALVQVEVARAVPMEEVVLVPWVPREGEGGYQISELTKVLGVELDPKEGPIDGEEVGKKISEYSREFSVVIVKTGPEPDRAVVFFSPDHRNTELRVVEVGEQAQAQSSAHVAPTTPDHRPLTTDQD